MTTSLSVALSSEQKQAVRTLLSRYANRHGQLGEHGQVEIVDAKVVRAGRPGLTDVIGLVDGRTWHVPLGIRDRADEFVPFDEAGDVTLGQYLDDEGEAVAFDVADDPVLCSYLYDEIASGLDGATMIQLRSQDPMQIRRLHNDETRAVFSLADSLQLTVYRSLFQARRPGIEMLESLDTAGFNHLQPLLSCWSRAGFDLGFVNEYLSGGSTGWALALTSVRDLYSSPGPPELAGGDFASEAHRIGTMTARMHVSSDKAFGRQPADSSQWVDVIADAISQGAPRVFELPATRELLDQMADLPRTGVVIRVHGDFHLGRIWRTDQGWYVSDFEPPPPRLADEYSWPEVSGWASPLADVADMFWSFRHVARVAADERDPQGGLSYLASAWEERNRRAFLAGYLGVPGITRLVPTSRETVRVLVAAFELMRETVSPLSP